MATRITCNHVSFSILKDCHFTLSQNRTGLVGKNGAGKTTLLKLIVGELSPSVGQIESTGKVVSLAQLPDVSDESSVAEILGVADKLSALKRIENGSVDTADFDCVGNDWQLSEHIEKQFQQFNLSSLPLDQSFSELSGGERTRLMIVQCLLQDPDFLILDEPSNNLDRDSREALYELIEHWDKGLLVASHDRELLRRMDDIIELTPIGTFHYGGNYDFYVDEKATQDAAKAHEAHAQLQQVEKKHKMVKQRFETHAKAAVKGKRAKKAQIAGGGSYDKIAFNSAKGRSDKTLSRINTQSNRQVAEVDKQLTEAKAAIPIEENLNFQLPKPNLPNGKRVLEIEALCFDYAASSQNTPSSSRKPNTSSSHGLTGGSKTLIQNFNLTLTGPQRIAFQGPNGCGKSTLIKLILGELKPNSGSIKCGVQHIAYLDQFCSALNDEETVLENFKRLNPDQNQTQCHQHLAHFKFRNQQALVKASQLSGGEQLRALLACVLMASNPPQLLILDEPTNHLDLESIQYLEKVLQAYEGAMIVVSHDQLFLETLVCQGVTIQ